MRNLTLKQLRYFEALAQRFKKSKHKNTDLEILKAAIRAQLEKMIELNRTRTDFAEKFESLIEAYNAGSRSIEELFAELVKLSNGLNEEQERHVRENMSEEELAKAYTPFDEIPAQDMAYLKNYASSEGIDVSAETLERAHAAFLAGDFARVTAIIDGDR